MAPKKTVIVAVVKNVWENNGGNGKWTKLNVEIPGMTNKIVHLVAHSKAPASVVTQLAQAKEGDTIVVTEGHFDWEEFGKIKCPLIRALAVS